MKHYLVILCFAFLVACSGPKVQKSDLAPSTDLSVYKTFGFVNIDTTGLINTETYLQNIEFLKKSVASQMKARGYEEAELPDLKINMGIVVVEKAQTRETDFRTDRPKYMGQRNYSWKSEEVVVGYYKEGTLDFHLVDSKEKKMVWWATITDVLPSKQKHIPETIERNVKKIFETFPVKAKK